MKPNVSTRTSMGNLSGDETIMGIRPEDMAHVMGILDGLYSNRLLAVIREYATNARDAHIDAGFAGPIDVSLPGSLSPYLKVRDYGEGLDVQGIREVYSQYGRSTKRGSNDVVGMLGMGSKSALAYGTRSFTVTSVCDGRRIVVLIAKNDEGVGTATILGEADTDEASGVEVSIPINREDFGRAANEAADFFAYWPKGAVNLNGQPAVHFTDHHDVLRLSDSLFVRKGVSRHDDRVVMGCVPYPQAVEIRGANRDRYDVPDFALVAYVPIGSVDVVPSREGLKDTAVTKATLSSIGDNYTDLMRKAIIREVDQAPDHTTALAVAHSWVKFLGTNSVETLTYRGLPIPAAYTPLQNAWWGATEYERTGELRLETGRNSGRVSKGRYITSAIWHQCAWITDFEPQDATANHAARIKHILTQRGLTYGYNGIIHAVLCRDGGPQSPFVPADRIITWADVKAVKLPSKPRAASTGGNRLTGSYDCYTETGAAYEMLASDLAKRTSYPVVWVEGTNGFGRQAYRALLAAGVKHFTVVYFGKNRTAKFRRDFPTAVTPAAALKTALPAWLASLTADQLAAMDFKCRKFRNGYARLDANRVNSPALKEAIRVAKIDVDEAIEARKWFENFLGESGVQVTTTPFVHVLEDYPLATIGTHYASKDHQYLYINTMFAAGHGR